MKIFKLYIFKKDYKTLYSKELDNRVMLTKQNSKLSDQRIERDKQNANLKIEIEDLKGFLAQEKECSTALRKERTKLKREITLLKKELNKDGN
jgi:hypothetical protein